MGNNWVLITNHQRYVGVPFITSYYKRSPLFETYHGNELYIFHFSSKESALRYLNRYNSSKGEYILDRLILKDGEKVAAAIHVNMI